MKICFFVPSMQSGGAERTVSLLANLFVQNGDSVSLIMLDKAESFYELAPEIEQFKLDLFYPSRNIIQAVFRNIRRVQGVRSCLKTIKPEVVVSFGSAAAIAHWARIGMKIKLIGSERSNPYLNTKSFWGRKKKKIAKYCDGFLFQTEGASTYYPQKIKESALIVPNGILSEQFFEFDTSWEERADICAVGRMDHNKGFDDVIKAFSIVCKSNEKILLYLYGDGPDRSFLENFSKEQGIEDRVVFCGKNKNIIKKYSEYKYFITMSRSEGYPNVLLEAMASGCACVAANCDFGPGEIINDGENGFLVDVDDFKCAADRLLTLINNDLLAKQISDNAKAVRKTNDMTVVFNEIRNYIYKILKG